MELTRLEVLSEGIVASHVKELMALDHVIDAENWKEEEFRIELPDKFRYSRVALGPQGDPVGFVVASRKEDRIHVHRLAVGDAHQRAGVGRRLIAAVAASALRDGLETMTLKVPMKNEAARRFYERLGFRTLEATAEASQLVAANRDLLERLEGPSEGAANRR